MGNRVLKRGVRAAALVGTALTAFPAMAQDRVFIGPGGSWNVDVNWQGSNPPNLGGEIGVFQNNGAPVTITIDSFASTDGIRFDPGAPGRTIEVNSAFAVFGSGIVNNSGVQQTFSISYSRRLQLVDTADFLGSQVDVRVGSDADPQIFTTDLQFFDTSNGTNAHVIGNSGFGRIISEVSDGTLTIGALSGTGSFRASTQFGGAAIQIVTIGGLNLSTTYSGTIGALFISGNAVLGLTKVGTGTLTLSGNNIYTGGTIISGGTLQIGAGGTSGSIIGDVTNNAALVFNRSDALTYGGVISGTGSLTKLGTGTLILTNNNSYAGGTTISAGTLQVGNGGTAGSIAGNVLNNAAMVFNRSDNVIFGGVISGTGTMTKAGAGTLFLAASNSYTGTTTISQGTLQLTGTAGAIAGNIVNNAALVFGRLNNITYGGDISGTGTVATAGGLSTVTLTGTNTYTGTTTVIQNVLQIGNGGTSGSIVSNVILTDVLAALVFNRSDTYTYGGTVTQSTGSFFPSSVIKLGTGTLRLTGSVATLVPVDVRVGTLELIGSITSAVNVLAPAILSGTGTIAGNLVSSGTVRPGTAANPFGTLTTGGNYTSNAGSFFVATVGLTGSSLLSAGTATLNGGTVNVVPVGSAFGVQTDYVILTTTSGRTGTFVGLSEAALPGFLDASLSYTPNQAILRLRRNATNFVLTAGLSENQGNIGAALDAAIAGGSPLVFTTFAPLYNALLLAPDQLAANLSTVSGDALTAYPLAASGAAERFGDRMMLQGSDQKVTGQSVSLWGSFDWDEEDFASDGNGPGFDTKAATFQIGAEYHYADGGLVGISYAHADSDVGIDRRSAFGDVKSSSVGAYFRHGLSGFYVAGAISYSWHDIDSERSLLNGGAGSASFDSHSWGALAEVGLTMGNDDVSIEPHLRGKWLSTKTESFTEAGPLGILTVDAETFSTGRIGVGFRVANRNKSATIRPFGLIAYEYELGDDQAALVNELPGLPAFRVLGTELGKHIGIMRVGVAAQVGTVSFFGALGGTLRANHSSKYATGGIKVTW